MREISLTHGGVALVDDEDYDYLNRWKWRQLKRSNASHAQRNSGNISTWMHRVIMGLQTGDKRQVDHINHNGLDNRKSNLRICTQSQNLQNSGKYSNNTSGYKGVHWRKKEKKWGAQIKNEKRTYWLGYFDTREEAAMAYNNKALELHGEFAYLNIIKRG